MRIRKLVTGVSTVAVCALFYGSPAFSLPVPDDFVLTGSKASGYIQLAGSQWQCGNSKCTYWQKPGDGGDGGDGGNGGGGGDGGTGNNSNGGEGGAGGNGGVGG